MHHGFPDGSSVTSNANLSSLIRGIFNVRPPKRSLLPEGDLPLVLRSGKHLEFRQRVVMLPRAGFLAKETNLWVLPLLPIELPDIRLSTGSPDDAPWCPVRSLKFYLSHTKAIWKGVGQLFLSSRPPHGPASKATFARWVRDVITSAYLKK